MEEIEIAKIAYCDIIKAILSVRRLMEDKNVEGHIEFPDSITVNGHTYEYTFTYK